MSEEIEASVVILPYIKDKVLMQLRDIKPDISFPGCWWFFGGLIKKGETPKKAAHRELFEETGYRTPVLHKLNTKLFLNKCIIHSYFCPLTTEVDKMVLKEGLDFALVSFKEVSSNEIYSKKMKKYYPIADTDFIANTVKNLFNQLKNDGLLK